MDTTIEPRPRHVWAMGLANATYGFCYAGVLVTMPQVLAAHGVAQPVIARLTALATFASLATFFVAPLLDTLISRRAWTIGLGVLSALIIAVMLTVPPTGPWPAPLMMAGSLALVMLNTSLGGWLGAALPKSMDDTVGTWFTIGNAGGFGVGALVQYELIADLPAPQGQIAVGLIGLVPLAVLPLIPTGDTGRKAVRESFDHLARDLAVLIRTPLVLRIALLFALPCAAFTLTNALGGMGPDFHVSAHMVDAANGFGATGAGMAAALLARWCLGRLPAPVLYLGMGTLGALFTLIIIAFPHTAPFYLAAVLGENVAQSFAQVAQNAILFGSIRRGSPLAASQFGLLTTAFLLPYAYMLALDGLGYQWVGNVEGSFRMDAGVSLAACALLVVPVWRWMRGGKLTAPDADDGGNWEAARGITQTGSQTG